MSERLFGLGFDTHPREVGRDLWLAGVHFPGEPGLSGHSDADVVCHAIGDGLLGAAGLGDLGDHFPDTDAQWAGVPGLELLVRVVELLAAQGVRPVSCDATVIAERPRLGDARAQMAANLAHVLGVEVGRVSIKATRPEGLGLAGDGAGCLALAVAER